MNNDEALDVQEIEANYTHISNQYDGVSIFYHLETYLVSYITIRSTLEDENNILKRNEIHRKISNIRKWIYNFNKQQNIPYMITNSEDILKDFGSELDLLNQELVEYRKGILILQRIRLCHLLKKISFKYWYETLNEEGVSRMCLKDLKS